MSKKIELPRMPPRRCWTCCHFRANCCKRNAPIGAYDEEERYCRAVWPRVGETDLCGEWKLGVDGFRRWKKEEDFKREAELLSQRKETEDVRRSENE